MARVVANANALSEHTETTYKNWAHDERSNLVMSLTISYEFDPLLSIRRPEAFSSTKTSRVCGVCSEWIFIFEGRPACFVDQSIGYFSE